MSEDLKIMPYGAFRITFQSSEQCARACWFEAQAQARRADEAEAKIKPAEPGSMTYEELWHESNASYYTMLAERDALKARVAELEEQLVAVQINAHGMGQVDGLAQRDREVLALRDALLALRSCAREALASTAQAGEEAERRMRQEERERCRPFMHHEEECYYGWKGGVIGGPEHCTCGLDAILGTEPNP